MRALDWSSLDEAGRRDALARPARRTDDAVTGAVRQIFDDIRDRGEAALDDWCVRLDAGARAAVTPGDEAALKTAAGMASISRVENRGAVPAGTYSPAAWIGRQTRRERTPGVVSIQSLSTGLVASWKRRTFSAAVFSAASSSCVTAARASATTSGVMTRRRGGTPSSFTHQSFRAASPRSRMSSKIWRTASLTAASVRLAGRASASRRPASSRDDQSSARITSSSRWAGPEWPRRRQPSASPASPRTRTPDTRRGPPRRRRGPPAG